MHSRSAQEKLYKSRGGSMSETNRNVVIWGDGSGSTFRATVDAIAAEEVDFTVTGVITTGQDAGILDHVDHARSVYGMDIASLVIDGTPGKRQDEATQERVLKFLESREARSLSLMGAMVIMGATLVRELNGDVPEEPFPKTFEGARDIMEPSDANFGNYLPHNFPRPIPYDAGRFGLTNTHPAPSVITANTHGPGASRRVIDLRSIEGGHTFHVVGYGVDTGPVLSFNRFQIEALRYTATEKELDEAAQALFDETQDIEKKCLPHDLEAQLIRREPYTTS